jgi:hypothetical protein
MNGNVQSLLVYLHVPFYLLPLDLQQLCLFLAFLVVEMVHSCRPDQLFSDDFHAGLEIPHPSLEGLIAILEVVFHLFEVALSKRNGTVVGALDLEEERVNVLVVLYFCHRVHG